MKDEKQIRLKLKYLRNERTRYKTKKQFELYNQMQPYIDILEWILEIDEEPLNEIFVNYSIRKQLQKEIGDDSQQPRMKQTRGGELKSDEGLHSTDNGSPADTFSKEDSEDICICGHHTKDHSYDPNKLDADLECDICNCMGFKTKEDRSFLGGYAEFWDNPEDDRWDKEEEKQDA
jgi:hypothetical protein